MFTFPEDFIKIQLSYTRLQSIRMSSRRLFTIWRGEKLDPLVLKRNALGLKFLVMQSAVYTFSFLIL